MTEHINVTTYPRMFDRADEAPEKPAKVEDLRGKDASRTRDKSAHRRSTWLYEDLLN